MTRRNFSNSASVGTISGALNNTDDSTTVTLSSGALTSWPSTPCTAVINVNQSDEEVVLVTLISGSNATLTRGFDSSAKRSHSPGATLVHASVARDFDEANAHVNASSAVHGLAASSQVVGTNDSQSLTNKSLVAPSISDFTNASHDHSSGSKGGAIAQASVTGLVTALNGKANTAEVVKVTTDQTVAGDKTFTGDVDVTGALTRDAKDVWAQDTLVVGTYSGTTDASSFVTVTHSLGWTPTRVFCQLVTPSGGVNAGVPVVTNITATTFTVRMLLIQGNVAGLGVSFYWLAQR